jgi:hypothetical protein
LLFIAAIFQDAAFMEMVRAPDSGPSGTVDRVETESLSTSAS